MYILNGTLSEALSIPNYPNLVMIKVYKIEHFKKVSNMQKKVSHM